MLSCPPSSLSIRTEFHPKLASFHPPISTNCYYPMPPSTPWFSTNLPPPMTSSTWPWKSLPISYRSHLQSSPTTSQSALAPSTSSASSSSTWDVWTLSSVSCSLPRGRTPQQRSAISRSKIKLRERGLWLLLISRGMRDPVSSVLFVRLMSILFITFG
jgi:hypothetical protein